MGRPGQPAEEAVTCFGPSCSLEPPARSIEKNTGAFDDVVVTTTEANGEERVSRTRFVVAGSEGVRGKTPLYPFVLLSNQQTRSIKALGRAGRTDFACSSPYRELDAGLLLETCKPHSGCVPPEAASKHAPVSHTDCDLRVMDAHVPWRCCCSAFCPSSGGRSSC